MRGKNVTAIENIVWFIESAFIYLKKKTLQQITSPLTVLFYKIIT